MGDPMIAVEAARSLSGIDLVRRIMHSEVPPPPIFDLVDFHVNRVVMAASSAPYSTSSASVATEAGGRQDQTRPSYAASSPSVLRHPALLGREFVFQHTFAKAT
jgi:hypothetical protein